MTWRPTGVHPVADLFPMMTADELADLAADIKANGLIHAIVVDADGQLIDGRNRLAACGLAGVEPEFVTLNGHDPVAYIIGANVIRRQLSKGQAAMAVARARLVSKQTVREVAQTAGVNAGRVGQATTVLDYAPDLADAVMSGATSLDDAYTEARRRKEAANSTAARMARLQTAAPDVADLVIEERMSLGEAEAAARARQAESIEKRRGATEWVSRVLALLEPPAAFTPEQSAAETFGLFDPDTLRAPVDVSLARLERCQAVLVALVGHFRKGAQ